VKQSDIVEYEENTKEKQKIQIYKIKHQLSLKLSHTDGKHHPPKISKLRRIKGFGENVNQLPLCVYISLLNVSLLYMISQEVVSPLKVSYYFVKTRFLATEMALVLSHMRGTLSKLTPKSLMVCTIHRIWEQQLAVATYSASAVD
jgi:hypothetical protein